MDTVEHPVVMEMTGGLIVPVEEETGVGRPVLVVAAFDRCALLSIWEAEGPRFKSRDVIRIGITAQP